ncbi:UNVERIFIED_CONTAM: hypothetical protein RMT77_013524 [Armadillidium vulgare]|nr:hypothetical protein Avbf_06988 [Armadillidium vulgare]
MAKWTGKKSNVMFSKPEEPSFLKKFKEKVGYKEDKGLAEKFEEMPKATAEDFEDRDDELPQVVQLTPGDISQEEYDNMGKVEEPSTEEKSEEVKDDEKILFRQPAHKRNRETSNDLKASTKKTKKEEALEEEKEKAEKEEVKKNKKKEKSNRTLLSFDEDDDTEDT